MAKYMIYRPKHYIDRKYRRGEPAGYCWCMTHLGYLDPGLIEKHDCIGKNCRFLQRYEQHKYWYKVARKQAEKERRKAEKAARKAAEARIPPPALPSQP